MGQCHRPLGWFLGGGLFLLSEVTLYMRCTYPRSSAHPLYRGTSLIRERFPLGPYSGPTSKALRWPQGGALFLMNEIGKRFPLEPYSGPRSKALR